MIFVTVGNATQPFARLLRAVDQLVDEGVLPSGEVVMQTGHTPFTARHCEQKTFLEMAAFAELMQAAEVVIAHCGAGTVHHATRSGKVPVVMPRRVTYGEHVDDQLELAQELAAQGRVILAREPADLPDAISRARARTQDTAPIQTPVRMLDLVDAAIRELTGRARSRP